MASLQEMMAYAENQDQVRNPWVGSIQKGVGGFVGGLQMGQQSRTAALDRALKIIDIQEKMSKLQQTQQNMTIAANVAKGAGLLPLDPKEQGILNQVYFKNLNPDKNTPKINTEVGKMATGKLADLYDVGWTEKGGVSLKKKAGMTEYQSAHLKIEQQKADAMKSNASKKDASDSLIRSQRIEKMATEAAMAEFTDQLRAGGMSETQIGMTITRQPPPQYIISKYRKKYTDALGKSNEKDLSNSMGDGSLDTNDLESLMNDGNY